MLVGREELSLPTPMSTEGPRTPGSGDAFWSSPLGFCQHVPWGCQAASLHMSCSLSCVLGALHTSTYFSPAPPGPFTHSMCLINCLCLP